jgi:hypothetical protein
MSGHHPWSSIHRKSIERKRMLNVNQVLTAIGEAIGAFQRLGAGDQTDLVKAWNAMPQAMRGWLVDSSIASLESLDAQTVKMAGDRRARIAAAIAGMREIASAPGDAPDTWLDAAGISEAPGFPIDGVVTAPGATGSGSAG